MPRTTTALGIFQLSLNYIAASFFKALAYIFPVRLEWQCSGS